MNILQRIEKLEQQLAGDCGATQRLPSSWAERDADGNMSGPTEDATSDQLENWSIFEAMMASVPSCEG